MISANPTIPPARPSAILIRWRCGCCCKSSATLPTKPRRLGATNSIHSLKGLLFFQRWNRHMVLLTDDWGELRALLRVFLKKGQFWGQKKGKGVWMIFVVELIKKLIEARNWKIILRYPRSPGVSMASLMVPPSPCRSSSLRRWWAGTLEVFGERAPWDSGEMCRKGYPFSQNHGSGKLRWF